MAFGFDRPFPIVHPLRLYLKVSAIALRRG